MAADIALARDVARGILNHAQEARQDLLDLIISLAGTKDPATLQRVAGLASFINYTASEAASLADDVLYDGEVSNGC